MIKRTIKETVREYDEVGKLVRESITETKEDDDSTYTTSCYTYPCAQLDTSITVGNTVAQ